MQTTRRMRMRAAGKMAAVTTMLLLHMTGPLSAETWSESDTEPVAFQLNATRIQNDESHLTLQSEPEGFNFADAAPLLGTYGTTTHDVIRDMAPHLEDAEAVLVDVTANGDTVHERWEFTFNGLPLFRTSIQMHFYQNQLVMLRTSLPPFRLVEDVADQFEFIEPEALGFTLNRSTHKRITRKVLANAGGMLAPAWHLLTKDLSNDAVLEQLIDARNGAILESNEPLNLQLAQVYEKGPADGVLIETQLPHIGSDGYLDGQYFSIFAPDIRSPRVQAPDHEFIYNPDDFADQINFDQVQAYYSSNKALDWFQQKLGVEFSESQIPIRVNDLVKGKADNALYIQPPFGPEIKLGKGSSTIRNLARDTDVMFHEFSHHIVYRFLKNMDGESGILHEGYADYFAYAINGDPYLGESVVAGKPWLRTAKLEPHVRYDTLESQSGKHGAGQVWSAVLWQIHEDMGRNAEKLIYQSLPYTGTSGGLRDAIIALLNADRDLNPLDGSDPEFGVYGTGKCTIMTAAVERGFATFIENLDATSCNMNLTDLAQVSRDIHDDKNRINTKGSGASIRVFGRKCSVVSGKGASGSHSGGVLLILPFILFILNRFRVRE